jgi:hypothetical protein
MVRPSTFRDDIFEYWQSVQRELLEQEEDREESEADMDITSESSVQTEVSEDEQCPICEECMEPIWLRECVECRERSCFLCRNWYGRCIHCENVDS